MKKFLFTIIAFMASCLSFAQDLSENVSKANFPGGTQALMEYLSANINYPLDAQKAKIQGRVIVEFVIDTDGKILETKILKSVCESCDKEAQRVIKSMPAWTPAQRDGKAVKMKYVLPVIFRLDDAEKKEVDAINEFGNLKDEA